MICQKKRTMTLKKEADVARKNRLFSCSIGGEVSQSCFLIWQTCTWRGLHRILWCLCCCLVTLPHSTAHAWRNLHIFTHGGTCWNISSFHKVGIGAGETRVRRMQSEHKNKLTSAGLSWAFNPCPLLVLVPVFISPKGLHFLLSLPTAFFFYPNLFATSKYRGSCIIIWNSFWHGVSVIPNKHTVMLLWGRSDWEPLGWPLFRHTNRDLHDRRDMKKQVFSTNKYICCHCFSY